jgi:hypothetical protein
MRIMKAARQGLIDGDLDQAAAPLAVTRQRDAQFPYRSVARARLVAGRREATVRANRRIRARRDGSRIASPAARTIFSPAISTRRP